MSDLLAPSSGDFLKYDGTAWNASPKPSYVLDEISDVNAPAPANNDVLFFNQGTSAWEP